MSFSKIPNSFFYGLNKEPNNSILKTIKSLKDRDKNQELLSKSYDKVIPILHYLTINTNLNKFSLFQLEDMILHCGYKPKYGEGKSIEQFQKILPYLNELKLISLDDEEIDPKKLYRCKVTDIKNSFFELHDDEFLKILNQCFEKVDNKSLLLYYCYLKSRMYRRSKDHDIVRSGGTAEACYPSLETIRIDTGLSENAIMKYNDLLSSENKLNLIRIGSAGSYYYKSDKHHKTYESANTYVLFKNGWEIELQESIKAFTELSTDKVFKDKNDNKELKQENGFIARIQCLQNKGKATPEQIEKLNALLDKRDQGNNGIKFSIKALLEEPKYKNMLLSEIYSELGRTELAEKYTDIEDSLEIFDFDYNLKIDRKYYIWLMVNYEPQDHERFYNCAQKHIKEITDKSIDEFESGDWLEEIDEVEQLIV